MCFCLNVETPICSGVNPHFASRLGNTMAAVSCHSGSLTSSSDGIWCHVSEMFGNTARNPVVTESVYVGSDYVLCEVSRVTPRLDNSTTLAAVQVKF